MLYLEVELFIDTVIKSCLPNAITLQELSEEIWKNQLLTALRQVIQLLDYIPPLDQNLLSQYNKILHELTIKYNIILRGKTLLSTLQNKCIQLARDGHQGLVRPSITLAHNSGFQVWTH